MNGTSAKMAGAGSSAVLIWLWNGVIGSLVKFRWPDFPFAELGPEAAVGVTVGLVALLDHVLGRDVVQDKVVTQQTTVTSATPEEKK